MTTLAARGPGARPSLPLAATIITLAAVTGALVAAAPMLIVPVGLLAALAAATLVSVEVTTIVVLFLLVVNAPGIAVAQGAPMVLGAAIPLALGIPFLEMARRGERIVLTPAFICLLVLLLVQIVSTLGSRHPDVAMAKLQTFVVEGVLLYFLISNVVRTQDALRRAIWVLIAGGACLAVVSIVQATTGTHYQSYGGLAALDPSFVSGRTSSPRAMGPLGDPNYFGQLLIVAAAMSLVLAWRGRTPLERLLAGSSTVVIAYAIALTYSRGTGVAFVLLLVLMAFLRFFKIWQVLAMVLGVAVMLVAVPSYADRVATLSSLSSATEETGSDPEADQSAQGRSTEALAAVHVFLDYPVLGVGPGGFPLYYREYAKKVGGQIHDSVLSGAKKGQESMRQAHNMFLGLAADLGMVGLLAFCGVLALTLRALARVRRESLRLGRSDRADLAAALLLALVGYLLAGAFLTLAFERYLWLLLGLAGAATSIALRDREPAGMPPTPVLTGVNGGRP